MPQSKSSQFIIPRSGTRKRLELRPWIWCILLNVLTLPCILSSCLNVDITLSLYPQGDINVRYGHPLEIFCVTDGTNYTSSDTVFIIAGKRVESEIVNSTTRRLYRKIPEKQSNTYYCQNTKNGKICTARVLVDSSPSDVTNFECISQNIEILNCSWTEPPRPYSFTSRSIAYTNFGDHECVPSVIGSTNYCVWDLIHPPRYRQLEEVQRFYMSSCNKFGCSSQNFTIDHYSIVKPDPPFDLKVLSHGTHSVILQWNIPINIIEFLYCGVDHILQYQIANVDNTTYFRTVDTSDLPTRNRTYRFNLTDLPYAHMLYEVRIYIKSTKAISRQYWSDYVYSVFKTSSDVPIKPPNLIAGAFDQDVHSNERVINVYWQEIEEIEKAGPNFMYKVLVSQGKMTQVLYPAKGYVSLNVTVDALDISVWSLNINGTSLNSSHIYIPAEKDSQPLKISCLTKVSYENGTYELSWDGIINVDSYTLFWCQHNGDQICTGRIDYDVLDPSKTWHIIDLPEEYRYQFAISANSGTTYSGV